MAATSRSLTGGVSSAKTKRDFLEVCPFGRSASPLAAIVAFWGWFVAGLLWCVACDKLLTSKDKDHRCPRCLRFFKRTGHDRLDPVQNLPRAKPIPTGDIGTTFNDPQDAGTQTYAEWCEATGFDPKRREYVNA